MLTATDERTLVRLDPDHPGFRDPVYRARRDAIAHIATDYTPGAAIPDAPYVEEEHEVWRTVWRELRPAHERFACAEFRACREVLLMPEDRIPQLGEVSERVREL